MTCCLCRRFRSWPRFQRAPRPIVGVEPDRLLVFDVCAVAAPALIIEPQPWPAELGTSNAGDRVRRSPRRVGFSYAHDPNRPALPFCREPQRRINTRGRELRQAAVRGARGKARGKLGFPAAFGSQSGEGRLTARRISISPGTAEAKGAAALNTGRERPLPRPCVASARRALEGSLFCAFGSPPGPCLTAYPVCPKGTGPTVESCSPRLIASRVDARRRPSGCRPGFWPQGQSNQPTPFALGSPPGLDPATPQSPPSPEAISDRATRPIDLQREMNDPAVAASSPSSSRKASAGSRTVRLRCA
jgi:hypothetical protein